jgi:hypothetical protein
MTYYAGMAVGINRYQHFQTLSYAQADARALQQFLQEEMATPQNCFLLSDSSAWVDSEATYPTRDNLLHWLHNASDHLEHRVYFSPEAVSWFFFSGYGVYWEGEDYLMPIDGNPDDVPGTGIRIQDVFEALQKQGARNLLVLLDVSRSPGFVNGEGVGQQTLDLARKMGIAVLLSTQVGEFSYEAAALGHGMFTAALLEALRYYRADLTLAELEQYLRDRLPEFSEHHWRPVQTPVLVVPSSAEYQQPILPGVKTELTGWEVMPKPTVNPQKEEFVKLPVAETPDYSSAVPVGAEVPENLAPSADQGTVNPKLTDNLEFPPDQPTTADPERVEVPENIAPPPQFESRVTSSSSLEQWDTPGWYQLVFWGGSIALVLVIGLLFFFGSRDAEEQLEAGEGAVTSIAEPTGNIREISAEPTNSALVQARLNLQDTNASALNEAIVSAQRIPEGDPFYPEAQENISRWSRTIFDIALGRAAAENYENAIAAARLISEDQTQLYNQVLPLIETWKVKARQKQENQGVLTAAQDLINPGQASSYNRAIDLLKQISPDEPLYTKAQEQREAWSEQIYLIANTRAAQGNYEQAIAAAQLVPEETDVYGAAQDAIAEWQANL